MVLLAIALLAGGLVVVSCADVGSSTNTSSTSNSVTTIQCESMTKGGQYAEDISSPFNGVRLYANNDKVSYNHYFSNNKHTFTLCGSSADDTTAEVQLKIGGTSYGSFKFGSGVSIRSITAAHNKGGGSATVELIFVNARNQGVNLDYLGMKFAN